MNYTNNINNETQKCVAKHVINQKRIFLTTKLLLVTDYFNEFVNSSNDPKTHNSGAKLYTELERKR
jgi:hypothetical protein